MVSLPKFLVATLVFLTFIVGGMFVVHDMEDNYADFDVDMGVDKYINHTYNLTTNTQVDSGLDPTVSDSSYEATKNLQGRMLDKQVDEDDTESSMFAGAFSTFRLIPSSIKLVNNVLNDVSNQLGIHPIFVTIAFSVIVILVIFSIIFLIFRVKS